MKLGQFLCVCFCSLFLLFVGLDRAQNTDGIEMEMINKPVETSGLTGKTKQGAR